MSDALLVVGIYTFLILGTIAFFVSMEFAARRDIEENRHAPTD